MIKQENFLLTFVGEFDKEIDHPHLGVIRRGTISHEFYWLDRWYNVFRFHEPDGKLRNFYCNINMLPTFEKKILNYVDLDIDVLVWKDFSFEILDLDEFEENAVKYHYSPQVYDKANESLAELIVMIEKKSFPFSRF